MADHKQEIIDIVDANNNIIGQASRQEVHEKGLKHRAAHIFVAHQEYIYLQLRSSQKRQFPNKWDISAAGHVDSGETYVETAIREVKEELNIDLNIANVISSLKDIGDIPASKDNGYEFIKIFYINFTEIPDIKLAPDEITTGGWFKINDITHWLSRHPEQFAGGFDRIWQCFCRKFQ